MHAIIFLYQVTLWANEIMFGYNQHDSQVTFGLIFFFFHFLNGLKVIVTGDSLLTIGCQKVLSV